MSDVIKFLVGLLMIRGDLLMKRAQRNERALPVFTSWFEFEMFVTKVLKSSLELTLAILKPDVCKNPLNVNRVRRVILANGFYFVRTLEKRLTRQEAELFYAEHRG